MKIVAIGAAVFFILTLVWPFYNEFTRCRATHPRRGTRCRLSPNHFGKMHTDPQGHKWI